MSIKYKLDSFKYSLKNFFYNVKLFFPLLIGYKWFGANYALEIFLKKWLEDGIEHYSSNKCVAEGHLEIARQMKYALELVKILEDEFYFIDKNKRNFTMELEDGKDEHGHYSVKFIGETPTKEDYEDNDRLRKKIKKELFIYLASHYESWWD